MSYRDNAQPSNIVSGGFGTEVVTLDSDGVGQGSDQDCRSAIVWPDPETDIVVGGDFTEWDDLDTPTGWANFNSPSPPNTIVEEVPPDKCRIFSDGLGALGVQQFALSVGVLYRFSFDLNLTSGSCIVFLGTGTNRVFTTSGRHTFIDTCLSNTALIIRNTGAGDFYMDNVVVKPCVPVRIGESAASATAGPILIPAKYQKFDLSNTNKLYFNGTASKKVNILWRS